MNTNAQNSSASQEQITDEFLKFLDRYGTNLKSLVQSLENNNQMMVNIALSLIVREDLGAHIFSAEPRIHERACRARLVDPLKAIEADLKRANKFTDKSASPTLKLLVPGHLQTVQFMLTRLQKTSGDTSQKAEKEKKSGWQFWK